MKTMIYAHGSLSESYWRDASSEYVKRLSRLWPLRITEAPEERLPSSPSAAQIEAALEKEGKRFLSAIPPRAYVIALCVEGESADSPALSRKMEEAASRGASEICFVIGSSFGLSPEVKARADWKLSLSRLTFPHQLARVMLCEQIYRAAQIARGAAYHK